MIRVSLAWRKRDGVTRGCQGWFSPRALPVGDHVAPITIVAVVALLLVPGFWRVGFPMDEGQLLAYPEWIRQGALPHRDFESSYGPGMLWILAGAFRWLGASVGSERLVGLLFRLLIVAGVYRLAWTLAPPERNREERAWLASAAAATSCALLVPSGLYAFAWFGALACVLWSLSLLIDAASLQDWRNGAAAGLLAALGVSFRIDLGAAIALSAPPVLLALARRGQLAFLGGLMLGSVPLTAHVAAIGTDRAWRSMFVEPVLLAAPGRRLPFPPRGATDAFFVIIAGLAATVLFWLIVRRLGVERGPRARAWLSLSALSLAALPQLFQRADAWHAIDLACFTLPLLPLALGNGRTSRARAGLRALQAMTVAVGLAAAVIGVAQGSRPVRGVTVGGRGFPLTPSLAADLRPVLRALDQAAASGDRLFVGPRDLRRTNYGDTFIYFLFPRLAPASYFTEMNPGVANEAGSSLAGDLAGADFLILTRRFDDWNEPNRSSLFGPEAPARVVTERFCSRLVSGSFELLERCDRRRAIEPDLAARTASGSAREP